MCGCAMNLQFLNLIKESNSAYTDLIVGRDIQNKEFSCCAGIITVERVIDFKIYDQNLLPFLVVSTHMVCFYCLCLFMRIKKNYYYSVVKN
jgi:hypothetical protein